jgi:hypothetical protein
LTRDDLRAAVGRYAKTHGLVNAQANIPLILGCSILEVPETEDALMAAIFKVECAISGFNPGNGYADPVTVEEPVQATKDDVAEGFRAYAQKYDGQCTDLNKATNTLKDGPAILESVFGKGVHRIAQIPASPENYGKALAAINKAINENTYDRKAMS